MTAEHPEPRRLRDDDVEGAARTVARAFALHAPWAGWAFPDPSTREDAHRPLIATDIAELFIPWGEAWGIGTVAVTLWMPPASTPGAERFELRRDDPEYAAYGEREELMREFDELVESMRPGDDHWYLDTIATDPDRMGEGLGARLLEHDLALRDAEGALTALDTQSERTADYYSRFGYEVVERGRLPGEGPPILMMVREAR